MLYTIGDLHLSLGSDKPMEVFPGWDNYVERIENNWNRLISENDTVVVPGDISWAMDIQNAVEDFKFIESLNGRKILLKGNHDYWWTTMSKLNAFKAENNFESIDFLFNNAYLADNISVCGTRGWFYDVPAENLEKVLNREAGRLRMSIEAGLKLGGTPVVFLHYPPLSADRICTEITNVLHEYDIKRVYFGHLHSEKTGRFEDKVVDGIRYSLVSADFLNFTPKAVFV
ncbi:MAG TPA: serine/threonine protein phosphatase [Clostridiales bacterium]|nr:serine/threonine protein phosphatase [Clostridiales bacterium]